MRIHLSKLLAVVAVATGLVAGSPRASANYILDSFDVPAGQVPYAVNFTVGPSQFFQRTDTNITPGVDRVFRADVLSPTPANSFSASGHVGGGTLFSDSDNSSKVQTTLTYTFTTPASGNLTGATGIELDFIYFNSGVLGTQQLTTPVAATITTSAGTFNLSPTTITAGSGSTPDTVFSLAGIAGLSNVSSIQIVVNGGSGSQMGVDFSLDAVKVQTVPAPPAVVLAGIGFLGLLGRSRLLGRKVTA